MHMVSSLKELSLRAQGSHQFGFEWNLLWSVSLHQIDIS